MGSGDPSGLQNRREFVNPALVSSTLTRFRHPQLKLAKVGKRNRPEIDVNQLAGPPGAALAFFAPISITIVIEERANKLWRLVVERIIAQQLECRPVIF